MEKKKTEHKEFLLCDCKSTEHQILIHYDDDPEWDNVYMHVHLNPDCGFWKRLIHAIKYLFGHRSRYGDFDEFIFDPDDAYKIQKIATHLKKIKTKQQPK